MRAYKIFSLSAASVFAAVGTVFLFFPNAALILFNNLSYAFALPVSPEDGTGFYLALAAAYMYLVTLLAWQMYRHPGQDIYPMLLVQAKLASSFISLYLFFVHQPYLIYFANFITDGCIGIAALILMKRRKAGDGK